LALRSATPAPVPVRPLDVAHSDCRQSIGVRSCHADHRYRGAPFGR